MANTSYISLFLMTRARVAMKRRIYHFDERYSLAGRVSDGTLIDNRLICSLLSAGRAAEINGPENPAILSSCYYTKNDWNCKQTIWTVIINDLFWNRDIFSKIPSFFLGWGMRDWDIENGKQLYLMTYDISEWQHRLIWRNLNCGYREDELQAAELDPGAVVQQRTPFKPLQWRRRPYKKM